MTCHPERREGSAFLRAAKKFENIRKGIVVLAAVLITAGPSGRRRSAKASGTSSHGCVDRRPKEMNKSISKQQPPVLRV
jgi:hypothetical protein